MPEDAIGILIDLARRGEIDPWDIDVVQLTDRFLRSLERIDASDLARSGQALFYASVLVRMKAEILEGQMQETPPEEDSADDFELAPEAVWPVALERVLRRRSAAPAMSERPLTLNDLIAHLKEVEHLERQQGREHLKERRPALKGVSVQTMEQIEHLAHHENLEALVAELWELLSAAWNAGTATRLELLLQQFPDRVGAFLGLLFLAHRSQVVLSQDEFYQDIAIYAAVEDAAGSRLVSQSPPTHA